MKSETYASIKYILAVMGLAVMAAGQVLVDHSAKIDAMDDELPDTNDYLEGTGAAAPLPQITVTDIADAQRDSSGLPYDARIHSGNKTLNQDGTWKKRKGVSNEIVDAVTAELRAVATPPVASAVVAAAAAPVATPAPVAAIAAPVAIAAPTPVAIPVPVAAPVANDYTKLCDFLAKNTGEGFALNDAYVAQFFAVNETSLPAVATDQPKCALLLATLRKTLADANIAEVA